MLLIQALEKVNGHSKKIYGFYKSKSSLVETNGVK